MSDLDLIRNLCQVFSQRGSTTANYGNQKYRCNQPLSKQMDLTVEKCIEKMQSGDGCSKVTMLLVKVSLKFEA